MRQLAPRLCQTLAVAALCGCAGAPMPFDELDDAGRPAARRQQDVQAAADGLCQEVSNALQLPFLRPVVADLLNRQEVRVKIEEIYRASEGIGADAELDAAEEMELDFYSASVLGFYNPADRFKLVVVDDVYPVDRTVVMRHELFHALQDQHWPLRPLQLAAKALGTDASLSLSATIEGQATVVQAGLRAVRPWSPYNPRRDGSSLFGDASPTAFVDFAADGAQLSTPVDATTELFGAAHQGALPEQPLMPLLSRFTAAAYVDQGVAMFPYVAGKDFIQALRSRGSLLHVVRQTLERPPVSTRQVLHPEAYLAAEAPEPVSLAATRAYLGTDADAPATVGEYLTAVAYGATSAAFDLACGWRGDAALRASAGDAPRYVWATKWADEAAAAAALAYVRAQEAEAQARSNGLEAEQDAGAGLPPTQYFRFGRVTVMAIAFAPGDPALAAALTADLGERAR